MNEKKLRVYDWVIELKTGHVMGGPGCFYGNKKYAGLLGDAALWGNREDARYSAAANEVVRKVQIKNGRAVKVISRK